METKNISNITVKEIFERMLGEENANIVLLQIQEEFDKGTRGEELESFAKQVIDRYTPRIEMRPPIAIYRVFH